MLESYQSVLLFVAGFAVLALAAGQIGVFFARLHLPLISGFLFAGILIGPFVLDFLSEEAIAHLEFVNEISLAFIAFAAGSELYLRELRSRLRSIAWVTGANAIAVPVLGSVAVFLLAGWIPFMSEMGTMGRVAVALLASAILVARSPSSAIAIVNELRAKGPFTRTTLGVTMLTDVVVIALFAVNVEIADALLTDVGLNVGFAGLLLLEFALALSLGYLAGKLIHLVLALRLHQSVKTVAILLVGYLIFEVSREIRAVSHELFGWELLLEPLLIAMIASFIVTNYTRYRDEFLRLLHKIAPAVYIAFFTLTGAALGLDVLAKTWAVALGIFAIRVVAIFIGSFGGGTLAGDPPLHNRLSWMAYVTQAGVGLGLATEVAVEFPAWGEAFATVIISVIVMSQIFGPPLYKWAIHRVGEAHERATPGAFDGVRDALIFGVDDQSVLLARQLQAHGWQAKLACLDPAFAATANGSDVDLVVSEAINKESLAALEAEQADAIIAMLPSDEENYRICALAYETYGTETIVVRLNERVSARRFHELGALIVEPGTAIVSLLDHFVRSPAATSLLLGLDDEQDVIDAEVRNPALHGMPLRDLRLPLDTLILSVRRKGHTIISHGYTRLELGDVVTVVGSPEGLEQVLLRFDEEPRPTHPLLG
jgi:Trk K+ transport system NAD-binding subunit/NhaP-type Na+/H+ or K+/H+ antiporter